MKKPKNVLTARHITAVLSAALLFILSLGPATAIRGAYQPAAAGGGGFRAPAPHGLGGRSMGPPPGSFGGARMTPAPHGLGGQSMGVPPGGFGGARMTPAPHGLGAQPMGVPPGSFGGGIAPGGRSYAPTMSGAGPGISPGRMTPGPNRSITGSPGSAPGAVVRPGAPSQYSPAPGAGYRPPATTGGGQPGYRPGPPPGAGGTPGYRPGPRPGTGGPPSGHRPGPPPGTGSPPRYRPGPPPGTGGPHGYNGGGHHEDYHHPTFSFGFFYYNWPGFYGPFYYGYWAPTYTPYAYYSPFYYYGYFPYVSYSRVVVAPPPACTYTVLPPSYYSDYYLSPGSYSGLDAALSDIRNAWMSGNADLIRRHTDSGANVAVYLDGKYSYTLSGTDYSGMTRDAVTRIRTIDFSFYRVSARSDGGYTAYATHQYYDADNNPRTVYVSYTLNRIGDRLVITAAGSSDNRLG